MLSERSGYRYFARKTNRRRVDIRDHVAESPRVISRAGPGYNEPTNIRPPAESEDEKNRRESDVKVSAEFVRRFTEEAHDGRAPPDPSVLPEVFTCIHCNQVVRREENDNPWVC
ncbi:hypothetical protein F5Y14DRAFT_395862 [Nemania sp. NC0429]|nr:hypothetical protein F5Y14DRAFT_395862 [Nemania sp. NC0429]